MNNLKIYATLLTGFFLSCSGNSQKDFNTQKNTTQNITSEINSAEITSFFVNFLSGKENIYRNEHFFSLSEKAQISQKIWQIWQEANAQNAPVKLPVLTNFNKTEHQWNLPISEVSNPTTMPFWYGFRGEKPSNGYPLFVYLHGSGNKHAEFNAGYNFSNDIATTPSAHFVPQIPNEGQWYRWWQKSKQWAWEHLLREAFLSKEIDPNRIYFFGISEGGYGSQRLASFYADYLAGAGPMAGGEPLKNAPAENCQHIAFSLRTGSNDTQFFRNILTQYTKEEFERLKNLYPNSVDRKIEIIEGYGHGIPYHATPQWLKNYSRNPYPKQFVWEDFEMDGLHRKGFYNLAIKERPSEQRTRYQVTINKNTILVQVENIDYQTTEIKNYGAYPIETKFQKTYTPATSGKFIIYLNEELIDLNNEINVFVNGKTAFKGKVILKTENLVNSCATFFDSQRLFPAAIEVNISQLK